MPETRLLLLASSFLLPLACVGQSLPADKDWSADLAMYMLAPGSSAGRLVPRFITGIGGLDGRDLHGTGRRQERF